MDYQRIYNQLVSKRQQQTPNCYTERHHIIPKCMCGSNKKQNLVRLTAREHFIAHVLLSKIYKGTLIYAVHRMITVNKYNSKKYEWLRIQHSKTMSLLNKGRKHTEETKKKMSVSHTGTIRSDESKQTQSKSRMGMTASNDTKKKMSEAKLGKTNTEEHKLKQSNSRKGMKFSEEHKANMSKARSGKSCIHTKISIGKSFKLVDNNGNEYIVNNLNNFCRDYNLDRSTLNRNINKGIISLYRDAKQTSKNCIGWRIESI